MSSCLSAHQRDTSTPPLNYWIVSFYCMIIVTGWHILVSLYCEMVRLLFSFYKMLRGLQTFNTLLLLDAPFLQTVKNQHQLWIHSIWWTGQPLRLTALSNGFSIRIQSWWNEAGETLRLKPRNTMNEEEKSLLSSYNSRGMIKSFLNIDTLVMPDCLVEHFHMKIDCCTLVYTCVWTSRLFQSLAIKVRDWTVNLAPSQRDLTPESHQGLQRPSPSILPLFPSPFILFCSSPLLSPTINGLLSHYLSPINIYSLCQNHFCSPSLTWSPTCKQHLTFTQWFMPSTLYTGNQLVPRHYPPCIPYSIWSD